MRNNSIVTILVSSESENDYPGENRADSWKRRKEESLKVLKNADDQGVRMLWLADSLPARRCVERIAELTERLDCLSF